MQRVCKTQSASILCW